MPYEPLHQTKHHPKLLLTPLWLQELITTNQYQWTLAVRKETEVKGNGNTEETQPAHPNQPKETAITME